MRYRLIVFDWDGTIMDSTGLIAECIQLAARDRGLPVPTAEEGKRIIGLGLEASLSQLFPGLDAESRRQFAMRYRHHYVPRDHEVRLYDGIETLLASLDHAERFLAVATGKPRAGLERAFEYSGLKSRFHYSRCGDEGFAKPHPDMLLKLMEYTGVEADETLMIGDTSHDLELAANAGVDALGVTYGAHPRDHLTPYRSLGLFDNVEDMSAWLNLHA